MKKLVFLFCFGLFAFETINAQITIGSSSMPGANDTIRYSNTAAIGLNTTNTGTNYYWDFSTLIRINQGLYEYKSAFQTPYAFYFLGANKYGRLVADTIGVGAFTFTNVYNFYNSTASLFKTEGIGFKYSGLPLAAYYSDDDELYQFPLNYLDRDSSTFAFSISLGTGLSYSQVGYRINEIDGWGSIKTPYDSVACLRLVTTTYSNDSINFNGIGFSFPNNQRSYQWLSVTEKMPMLEISGTYFSGIFNASLARYRDTFHPSPLGLNENQISKKVSLFPNPSSGYIICANQEPNKITLSLTTIQGNCIERIDLESNSTKMIDVSKQPNGYYFYTLEFSDGKIETGKIIIAN